MSAPLINNISEDNIEEVDKIAKLRELEAAITPELVRFYAQVADMRKNQIDLISAEINQRQDKMRLVNDIIAEINNLTDEKNGLDISQNAELLEKLQLAEELGVKISKSNDGKIKSKFNAIERDRLIENLHLIGDNWDKENRKQTQEMEIHVKALDRLMMILKDVDRKEDQSKRPMLSGMRGAS